MQDLAMAVGQYGWMMWHVVGQSLDCHSAQAVTGVRTIVDIMKMLASSAPVRQFIIIFD